MAPGHQKIPGTRKPPSQDVILPSRRGPGEPPRSKYVRQGPLSLLNQSNVSSATPASSSALTIWPTDQSISSITSP